MIGLHKMYASFVMNRVKLLNDIIDVTSFATIRVHHFTNQSVESGWSPPSERRYEARLILFYKNWHKFH